MKAFQIAALLLSSGVLGAPTGLQGDGAVSAPNPVGSDSVTPTGDATSGDEADPSFTPPEGDSTANDPTETEEDEDPELTVTPSAGAEASSEDDVGTTPTYDDGAVSGDSGDTATPDDGAVPGEDSGGTTGEDAATADTVEDTSAGGGSKGFRSVLYFTNWGIYSADTQPQDIPADKVTHLLYAFADIKPDGEVVPSDLFADVQKQLHGSASGSYGAYTDPENTNGGTGGVGGDSSEGVYVEPDNTGTADPADTATVDTEGTNGDAVDPGAGSGSTSGAPENTGDVPEGTEDTSTAVKKRTGDYTGGEETTEGDTGSADTPENIGAPDTEGNSDPTGTIGDSTGSGDTTEDTPGAADTTGDTTGSADTTGDSSGAVDPATGGKAHGCVGEIFRLKKENRHLKVLLSIGGWTYSDKFPRVAASSAARQRFASSAVKLMADWGFDGLDIDWEYPKDHTEAQNFVLLLKACREALDEYSEAHAGGYHFELTVATAAGAKNYELLDMKGMDPLLDAWHLMAYDYAGGWDDTAGHQAALFPSQENSEATKFNTKDAVDGYLDRGIASRKIAVGIPLYGRSFMNTDGMGKPFSGEGQGSFVEGVWLYKDLPRPNAMEKWDESALAAYSYDPSTRELVTYDTVQSATLKAKWMVDQNLGGAVFWEASGDKQGDESLVCAVVGEAPWLHKTENLLDYPQSPYSNIRGGGWGGVPSSSEGGGSYGGGEDESTGNTGSEVPGSSATPPELSGTPPDSTGSPPDSSGPSDSSDTPPDSSGTPPGSSGTPDSSGSPPDSSGTPPDSSGTPPDSSGTPPDSSGTPPDSSTGDDDQSGDVGGGQYGEDGSNGQSGDDSSNIGGDNASGDIAETPIPSPAPDADATEPSSGSGDIDTGNNGNGDDGTVDDTEGGGQPGSEGDEPSYGSEGDDSSNGSNGDTAQSGHGGDDTVDDSQADSGEGDASDYPEGTPPVLSGADAPAPTSSEEAQVDDDGQGAGDDDETDNGADEPSGDEENDHSGEDGEVYVEEDNDADAGNDDASGDTELTPTPDTEGEQPAGDDEQLDDGETNTGGDDQADDDVEGQYVDGDDQPESEDDPNSTEETSTPSATPDTSGGGNDPE